MKRFLEFLNESTMTEKNMMKKIEASFKKQFPNGWFDVDFDIKPPGKLSTITFDIGLVGDLSQLHQGKEHNDPMHHRFTIYFKSKDNYEAQLLRGWLMVDRSTSKSGSLNTKFKYNIVSNKTLKANGDELVKVYDRWFKSLRGLVDKNKDNIERTSNPNSDDTWDKKFLK